MAGNNTFKIFLILVIAHLSLQEEDYEPGKDVCNGKCNCNNSSQNTLVLECTDLGLKHLLAKWPDHPKHMIATFAYNNITTLQQIPPSDATTISLSLSHCGIRYLDTELFIDAIGIDYLDLSWNYLTDEQLKSDTFRGRYNSKEYEPIGLRELDLAHNNIGTLGHLVFEHTPNLTRLNLSYNPIKTINLQFTHAISSLLKLRELNLANTSISVIPDEMLSRLQCLQRLDLSKNEFKTVPFALSYLTHHLEMLNLNENPIVHLFQNSFYGLYSLRELNISGMNDLESIQEYTFRNLISLGTLHCADNPKLSKIHHEAFGNGTHRPNLRELYLSNNHLESLSQFLLDWSHLVLLDLTGNRWDCNCELYYIILSINDTKSSIVTPSATCSSPSWASGIDISDIENLERGCMETKVIEMETRILHDPYRIFITTLIILMCIVLALAVCYFFWKVLTRYHNIRAINTMYPVMYISAPTTEY